MSTMMAAENSPGDQVGSLQLDLLADDEIRMIMEWLDMKCQLRLAIVSRRFRELGVNHFKAMKNLIVESRHTSNEKLKSLADFILKFGANLETIKFENEMMWERDRGNTSFYNYDYHCDPHIL